MKKIATNVLSLMVFVVLLTAAGYAQQPILKADVPFEFAVGKKTFPAGEYTVVRLSAYTLALRDANNGYLMSVVTEPTEQLLPINNPKLKFRTIGGQNVLSEIWLDGTTTGYELIQAKRQNIVAQTTSTQTATYVGK